MHDLVILWGCILLAAWGLIMFGVAAVTRSWIYVFAGVFSLVLVLVFYAAATWALPFVVEHWPYDDLE